MRDRLDAICEGWFGQICLAVMVALLAAIMLTSGVK